MKQCWRWFGPADTVNLTDLHQVGVTGIVTALHHILPGQVWRPSDIRSRTELLAEGGFRWDVVESLPVSEDIKTKGVNYAEHVQAYCSSLEALAAAGIKTVCYNFMPILDWTRTDLRAPQTHGGTAMQFTLLQFAVFDLHILERAGASTSYSEAQQEAASQIFHEMTDNAKSTLQRNIVAGLPGANDNWTVEDVRNHLQRYKHIDASALRQNLLDFLSDAIPTAERLGMRLCCHADDPPFSLLGLPRIMSSTNDYAYIMEQIHTPANGATLCTGSLGVAHNFNPVDFVERLGPRIHFVHLRNTKRIDNGDPQRPDFFESLHLEGDTDMVGTIKALMAEEARRRAEDREDWEIPMRPDHGQELLSDLGGNSMPGYPLIGRMRGLAELRGIMAAFDQRT